jgi:isopentenyl diphosphate isomerase/L-lactate dehydrogenase-like FMN-dependent dehydrogenase
VMDSLKTDNAQGVTDKINTMTEALAGVLARTGCKDIKSIDSRIIIKGDL